MNTDKMNTDKMNTDNPSQDSREIHLDSVKLLKYFLGTDDELDTLVKCKPAEFSIQTTDYELYEALGSLKEYDGVKLNKVVKLLETATVSSSMQSEKPVLKHERVEELRKLALKR